MNRSRFARIAAVSVIAIAGATLWAHESFALPPAMVSMASLHDGQHLARMATHLEAIADATPAQKAQIDALVAQASADFQAMRPELQQDRLAAHAILTQATIDRAQLETVRLAHMQLADRASKRVTQLMADVGDVLTPEQRQALGAFAQKMHAGH